MNTVTENCPSRPQLKTVFETTPGIVGRVAGLDPLFMRTDEDKYPLVSLRSGILYGAGYLKSTFQPTAASVTITPTQE
jgi:hypothetical protein